MATTHHDVEPHGLHAVTGHLEGAGVAYEVIEHEETQTAADESRAAHVPRDEMAKTVLLEEDGSWVVAVVPASHRLDVRKLREVLQAGTLLHLASEKQIAEHFPQMDVGAIPPVGPMLVGATVLDRRLLGHPAIVCAGGDHRHAIRLAPGDVVRVTDAHVADICED